MDNITCDQFVDDDCYDHTIIDDNYVWNYRDSMDHFVSDQITKKSIIYCVCNLLERLGKVLLFEKDRQIFEQQLKIIKNDQKYYNGHREIFYELTIDIDSIEYTSLKKKLIYAHKNGSNLKIGILCKYDLYGYKYTIIYQNGDNIQFGKEIVIIMEKTFMNDVRMLNL